jgi:Fe-S oxidoreductase
MEFIMEKVAMGVFIALGTGGFLYSVYKRFRLLKTGAPEDRFDNLSFRFLNLVSYAIFQKRLPEYRVTGFIHIIIFWGFLILLANSVILWGRAFDPSFYLFINEHGTVGSIYSLLRDIASVAVLLAATFAIVNRLVFKPDRMTNSAESIIILVIIITMMICDLIYWGYRLNLSGVRSFYIREPFASLIALLYTVVPEETMRIAGIAGFWGHSVLVLVFLNILPYGKHFHVVTSLPRVFFSSLRPKGELPEDKNINMLLADNGDNEPEDCDSDGEPLFGVSKIEQFTWSDMLDMYSCTECGRCEDNCPAAMTGRPLSPKKIITDLRDHLVASMDTLLLTGKTDVDIVPDVIKSEALWSCTTCRACEQSCPLKIEHVSKIIKLRRNLVESQSSFPGELAKVLKGMETNLNPWNISSMERDSWTEGLDIHAYDNNEYLFFAGCSLSFDNRSNNIATAFVNLMNKAGVSYGYLGKDEPCCGEAARRIGSESGFKMAALANVEMFKELGVKKIVTTCPHCYNTFKNEYPKSGGDFEVIHHTELLWDLLNDKKLVPVTALNKKIVYHDPCYLGRYNDIYSKPREILSEIPGLKITTAGTESKKSLCCGAGGGQFFKADVPERRINALRADELMQNSPDLIATACPYCLNMLDDGIKAKREDDIAGLIDIAELLNRSV